MQQRDMTFVLHTPQGDVTMQVLFTFYSEITDAHYMLYTPDDLSAGTAVRLSACRYDPQELTRILPLEGETDRQIVQSFINYISTHTPQELEKAAPAMEQEA